MKDVEVLLKIAILGLISGLFTKETKTYVRYLEVSPRQSGKTERLIKALMEDIDKNGKDVYLWSFASPVENITKRIPKEYHKHIKFPYDHSIFDESLNSYWDEPDYWHKTSNVIFRVVPNGYYVGTPRSPTNNLKYLASLNNNQYKKYHTFISDMYKTEFDPETFKQEYLGEYL